jgi:cell division protein FtsI/penicillin-binding protein 2
VRRVVIVLLVVAVVAAAAVVAVVVVARPGDDRAVVTQTAASFLHAWEEQDWRAMAELVRRPSDDFVAVHAEMVERLAVSSITTEPRPVALRSDTATVPFTISFTLAGLGPWRYDSELRLAQAEDEWRVQWDPTVMHPSAGAGVSFRRTRERPDRALIVAHDGAQLMGPVEVVEVGVQPSRIVDRAALLAVLAEHLGVDPASVEADLDRPGVQPDWFIPVARLRQDQYQAVEAAIYPVPGTVFRRTTARRPPADGFASHVLGRTGEITAELLDELGEPYIQHDVVGVSGLERAFEDQLGGTPSGEVQLVDGSGEVVEVLHRFDATTPQPLRITLDVGAQLAAEAALEGVAGAAAIVAVAPDSGDIRAVVSRPAGEFNRALSGRYAPGSTFKVVTAAAALTTGGVTADHTFDCRAEVRVGGKVFRNAGGFERGEVSFRDAFAHSCNTVFGPLGAQLDRGTLVAMARDFGFGASYARDVPLATFGGRFPEPVDDAEAAAAGIGQARVEASPLHMASVAAAVAAGGWRPPRLMADNLAPPAEALEAGVAATLQELMALVVSSGTGTAAAVPGRTIAGKTGSAEFDTGNPPPTHAWFIGYDERLAVAVLVEGGGSGGEVAAPVAGRFFASLPRT